MARAEVDVEGGMIESQKSQRCVLGEASGEAFFVRRCVFALKRCVWRASRSWGRTRGTIAH